MKTQLISFKTCPFVRRAVIVLLKKKADFEVTYIDLANKPEWFLKLSPTGKVPVLRVGDEVLFESAVISEYLDEVYPPSLHPQEPLLKAKNRAWIEFGSTLLMDLWQLTTLEKSQPFDDRLQRIKEKLQKLERVIKGPFFNGEAFCLVDAAYAPAFEQMELLEERYRVSFFAKLPKVTKWKESLLADAEVKKSVVGDFDELFFASLEKNEKSFLNTLKLAERF